MKKGILSRDTVEKVFKNSRYSVASFKTVTQVSKSYTFLVSGMT